MKKYIATVCLLLSWLSGVWADTEWIEYLENGNAENVWADPNVRWDDQSQNYLICAWAKERMVNVNDDGGWDPFPATIEQESNGNHYFVVHGKEATTEGDASTWDNQFWIQSPKEWKTGDIVKISFRYKASKNVIVSTQCHRQNPSDYCMWQAIGDINFTTEWQTYDGTMTISDYMSGTWSVAFHLNQNDKDAIDFYFDDLSWQSMKLDEGYFVAGCDPQGGLEYDFDNAVQFEDGVDTDGSLCLVATIGSKGAYVSQVMISTVRGNDASFMSNTIKPNGTITNDPSDWKDYAPARNAKLTLPSLGIWKIYLDPTYGSIAFEMIEGQEEFTMLPEIPNRSKIVVHALERDYLPANSDGVPQEQEIGTGQLWDNQFWIVANRTLNAGEKLTVKFKYKADKPARAYTQSHGDPGAYLHWAAIGDVNFTEDWQDFEKTFTVASEASGMKSIAFNLAVIKEANNYYIKDVIWMTEDHLETLINTEGTSNFYVKEGAGSSCTPYVVKGQSLALTTLPSMAYGGEVYVLPGTTVEGLPLTWTSSDASVAEVIGNVLTVKGAGVAYVTASQPGNDYYQPFSREYMLAVDGVVFDFATLEGLTAMGVDPSDIPNPGADSGTAFNTTGPFTMSGITITTTDGSTPSRIWSPKGNDGTQYTYRVYGNGTSTFTAPDGEYITSIVFNTGGWNSPDASCGDLDGKIWTGNANSVTFTHGGQCQYRQAVVFLNGSGSQGGTSSIFAEDIKLQAGETKTVDISLTNQETNLVGFQMDLTLPEGISINKAGCSLSDRIVDHDQVLTIGKQGDNVYRLTSTSLALTPISGTSGTLLTLSLTAADDSEGGTATLSNIRFATGSSERVTMDDTSFNITGKMEQTLALEYLPEMTCGDADYMLPETTEEGMPLTWTSSDTEVATVSGNTLTVNKEGTVTITATQAGNADFKPFSRDFTLTVHGKSSVLAKDVTLQAGEPMTVDISLANSEDNLVSFQMDLTLPEGISINKAGCQLGSRIVDPDQVLTIGKQGDNIYRLTSTSFALTPISGTSGTLLTLSLTASENAQGGTATLSDIVFATSNSEEVALDDTGFNITVESSLLEPTDISQIDNVIYMEPQDVRTGSLATLSFKMKNNVPIRGFQFDLYLPEGMTVATFSNGKVQASLDATKLPEGDDHQLTTSIQPDGAVRFLCNSQYDENFAVGDDIMMTVKVSVSEDMTEGEYPVELKTVKLSETDISKYYLTELVRSKVTVGSYLLGDVNADGVVDISDYISMANYIHGNVAEGFVFRAGDIDGNGSIDISDYIGVSNIIHTGSPSGNSQAGAKAALFPSEESQDKDPE